MIKVKNALSIKVFENNEDDNLNSLNPYANDYNSFAEQIKPQCKLTTKYTLISATQTIIDKQLGFVKLDGNEIISIIETINSNETNDW